jgi:acetoin utilization deacetylase AcuC-like enzyme
MTLLYNEPCFLEHVTIHHPECAGRIRSIPQRLKESGLAGRCRRPKFEPASRQRLSRVHSTAYINEVWALAKSGGGDIEADTVVSPASFGVALMAAGAVCDAAERLVSGEDSKALCLVRPPGHHALAGQAMGFCLFNNVAVAARMAVDELKLDRLLIVDWDIHHGNGTQATFWESSNVGFLSIHRWPFYPGSGDSYETGGGHGLGATLNLPVEFGISRKDYLDTFAAGLDKLAAKIKPQLIFISAGFDAHRLDPVGNLGLETEDFAALTNTVIDAAEAYCDGKVISVLEGGYNPRALTDSVEVHLGEMIRRAED